MKSQDLDLKNLSSESRSQIARDLSIVQELKLEAGFAVNVISVPRSTPLHFGTLQGLNSL